MVARELVMAVRGLGARSHLGLSALQCATGMRALALEPMRSPFLDVEGDPIGLALAESVPVELRGFDRFVALGAPALREATFRTRKVRMPMLLALPDAMRADQRDDARFERRLIDALAKSAGLTIDKRRSRVVRGGHAGFAVAVEEAKRMIGDHPDGIVLGGIDSHCYGSVLRELDERGALLRLSGGHGRLPGEAAAFLVVAEESISSKAGSRPKRPILRDAATERACNGDPRGAALGKLLRLFASQSLGPEVAPRWILSDVNGEPDRTDAWLSAAVVAADRIEGAVHHDVAQHTGDVGAATGAYHAVISITLASIGAVGATKALLAMTSDDQLAGVVELDLSRSTAGFQASRGEARDHTLRRAVGARAPSPGEASQLRRLARGRLEDIASMGMMLRPQVDVPHAEESEDAEPTPEDFASRLFDSWDAFAALGTSAPGSTALRNLREVARAHADAGLSDPPSLFAAAFVEGHLS